jgi:hypothetical protein
VDTAKGEVTVHAQSDDGKEEVKTEHMKLPADLANGLISTLIANLSSQPGETRLSMLVATPKPRLVKLAIRPEGEDSVTVVGTSRKSTNFLVKIEIGGIAGVVAPIVGKQPADTHVWILKGEVPTFLKSEGPLFQDGPIWRIELASPTWPEKK